MKMAAIGVVSVVVFLVAAKVHGRQLRLEREAAGYASVRFGGENPPWVEALWRAERVRFWSSTIALAVAILLARRAGVAALRPWATVAAATLLWAPSVSFLALGALSATRTPATAEVSPRE
jgi:hypothetical protein